MTWSIYDPTTGLVTSRVNNANQILERDHVRGNYLPGQWYVKNGEPCLLPTKPVMGPQVQFRWDLSTESWQINIDATAYRARQIRQDMLAAVDKVNPMWWAAMTPEQQAATAAYRQALLDITDQPGYPEVIDWPAKPAWL